jgi:ketosteroid isomerase-like protein
MSDVSIQSRKDIIRAMFAAGDSEDVDALLSFMTDDVQLVFANGDPIVGKSPFADAMRESRATLQSVRHEIHELWEVAEDAPVVVAEMTVHYTKRDATVVSLRCCNVFRMVGDRIADYRIYMDPSPLFA